MYYHLPGFHTYSSIEGQYFATTGWKDFNENICPIPEKQNSGQNLYTDLCCSSAEKRRERFNPCRICYKPLFWKSLQIVLLENAENVSQKIH